MCVNGDTGEVSDNVDPRQAYTDSHLDADKALDCPVALAYFIKAFAALPVKGQEAWIAAHSAEYRFELGSLAMTWGSGQHLTFYMALTAADVTRDDLDTTLGTINASLSDTPFVDEDYRNAYDMHLSAPMAKIQAASRNGDDDDDDVVSRFLNALMSLKD